MLTIGSYAMDSAIWQFIIHPCAILNHVVGWIFANDKHKGCAKFSISLHHITHKGCTYPKTLIEQ